MFSPVLHLGEATFFYILEPQNIPQLSAEKWI